MSKVLAELQTARLDDARVNAIGCVPFIFLSVCWSKEYTSAFSVNANAPFVYFINFYIWILISSEHYCCKDDSSIYSALY